MNYNDYTILTDYEYAKIADNYKIQNRPTANELISSTYSLLLKCKSCLFSSSSFKNYTISKELKQHIEILNKLEDNFLIHFNVPKESIKNVNDFNLFNYLEYLFDLNINLNNLSSCDLKTTNKILIKPFIKDVENLISSILKLLSKLNIHFFKFM